MCPMNCSFWAYEVCMNFRGVYCRGVTKRSGAAKISNFSHQGWKRLFWIRGDPDLRKWRGAPDSWVTPLGSTDHPVIWLCCSGAHNSRELDVTKVVLPDEHIVNKVPVLGAWVNPATYWPVGNLCWWWPEFASHRDPITWSCWHSHYLYHSVTHGQLWKPQHTYVRHVIWKSHFRVRKMSKFPKLTKI